MNGPGVPSFAEAPAKSARCEPRLWSPSHFNILPATATSPWAAALRLSRLSHKCEPCGRATWMRAFSARLVGEPVFSSARIDVAADRVAHPERPGLGVAGEDRRARRVRASAPLSL